MKSDLRAKPAYFKIDGLWLGAWCLDTLLAQPACSPEFSSPVSPDEWYDRPPKPVRGVRCGWEGSWLQQDNATQGLSRGGGGVAGACQLPHVPGPLRIVSISNRVINRPAISST